MSVTAQSPASPLKGRTLGDFVVLEKIGQGGHGEVYRAEQALLQREAVIKVLHARHSSEGVSVQRFLREAKLASRLDHPFAAHIYAFGAEPDGLLWIAMELVRGTPLDELIAQNGPLPLARLVPLFERICEVVQTAHDLGIVHRDIKPANVMVLSRAGRLLPKLLDLGIAKAGDDDVLAPMPTATPPGLQTLAEGLEDASLAETARLTLTHDGAILGSPSYMAPEVWLSPGNARAPADLYALGALAHEALTGKVVFSGGTLHAIARAHAASKVPPLGPGFPAALDAVFRKAMSTRAADRYATATELARALREAAGIVESSANLPRLPEPLRDQFLADAPQPIAEAIAALDSAQNVHQALDALWAAASVLVRYLGILGLASATRTDPSAIHAAAAELLQLARRRCLTEEEWLDLARALCEPFIARRDVHPVPELVNLFFSAQGPRDQGALDSLLALKLGGTGEPRDRLAAGVTALQGALVALGFLGDYQLGVPRAGKIELWTGVRRQHRTAVPSPTAALAEDQPVVVGADGAPILLLWPLVQVAPPAPGEPDELFVFDGQSRRGPRLVAPAHGFERRDPQLWEALRLQLGAADDEAVADGAERSPYRGLDGFGSDDARLFFGRERESEAVANRVRVQPLLAIVGPSGAGKSSFVQAGVLPLLPETWRRVTMRPGAAPLATLDAVLPRLDALAGDDHVVLVIDQFEELFTLCGDAAERARFCEAITQATRSPESRVRVILTLRDDFLIRAEAEPSLRDRLSRCLQLLTTPAAADLLRILVEPARAFGYDFEDRALAAEMVEAVADQAAALPLLSFTAMKLWRLRDRHFKQLRRSAYESLGKVGGALANHAEETLSQMRPEQQRLVREAFRHLVTADSTRAVLTRAELLHILHGGAEAEKVIEDLIGARLLQAREAEGRVEQIEIVHEALLSAWPRLAEWRREDAEGARIRDQLRAAARQWDQRGRPRGMLWRGEALAELELWRRRHGQGLTATDEAFAAQSTAERRRGRVALRTAVTLAFVVLTAGVISLLRLNGRAVRNAEVAADRLAELYEESGRKALLDGQPQIALAYLDGAYSRGRSGPAIEFLIARAFDALRPLERTLEGNIVAGDLGGARAVTVAADGQAALLELTSGARRPLVGASAIVDARILGGGAGVVTLDRAGGVARWDDRGARIGGFDSGEHDGSALLVDDRGERVAIVGERAVSLFALADGAPGRRFPHQRNPLASPRLSPDGRRLAAPTGNDAVDLWDVDGGRRLAHLVRAAGSPTQMAFSPDSRTLLRPDMDGSVLVVDAERGAVLHTVAAHLTAILSTAFAPAGDHFVTTSQDRTAKLWDLRTAALLAQLEGHTGPVLQARFAPDGASVLTVSEDGTGRVWDPRVGRALLVLHDHTGPIFALGFDGTWVLTQGKGGTRLWNATRSPVVESFVHRGLVRDAWLVHGDQWIAALTDGELDLWDRAGGKLIRAETLAADVRSAAVTKDGARFAIGDGEGVHVWDAGARQAARVARTHGSNAMRFTADGRRLVVAPEGGDALLLDGVTAAPLATLVGAHDVWTIASSDDGDTLATGGSDGVVRLWARDGHLRTALPGHAGSINAVAFDDRASLLVSASSDNTARVWTLAEGRAVSQLDAGNGVLVSAALSPDGALVATGSNDGHLQMWEARGGRLLSTFDAHAGAVFAVVFDREGKHLVTAGGADKTVRVWALASDPHSPAWIAWKVRCELGVGLDGGRPIHVPGAPGECAADRRPLR